MLRARDEGHAAGICRALSLPVCDAPNNGSNGSNRPPSGQSAGQSADAPSGRTVVFKSVPAVWNSEEAALLVSGGSRKGGCGIRREDDWVGLARALAATLPDGEEGAEKEGKAKAAATCDACAGFGCSWCDDGVVKVVEGGAGEAEEGLWETALCPPVAGSGS